MEEKAKRRTKRGEYWGIYDYWINKIIRPSFPLIIYGPNNEDRAKFLKSIASKYPFSGEPNGMYALYTDDVVIKDQKDKRGPDDIDTSNFLAREYLYLGIFKSFLQDMIKTDPEFAEHCCRNERFFLSNFAGMNISDVFEAVKEDMMAITEAYYGSHEKPAIHSLVYNPQPFINSVLRNRDNPKQVSYILDVRTSVALPSMHVINDLIAERDVTRLILPSRCVWRKVLSGEKHESVHDYSVDYLTERTEQIQEYPAKQRRKYFMSL